MNDVRASQRNKLANQYLVRIGGLLSAVLFIAILSAGCRYAAAPADLLQKPKIAEDKLVLVQAIEKGLPAYSKLTLPLREKNMEAIRTVDVDNDGVQEAVVSFYNEYSTPELMVFKHTDGKWEPWVGVEQPMARQIAWLELIDLDRDGGLELLIGWTGAFESPNVLELYSFGGRSERNEQGRLVLRPLETLPYSYAETGDLDQDGRPELAIITESLTNREMEMPEFGLTVYNWKHGPGGLKTLVSEELFNGVNNYDRIVIGRVSPGHNGLIAEASTGAHGTYTAMYAWTKGKLALIYPNAAEGQEGVSGKPTMSGDVDGDGIIELSWTREAPDGLGVPYVDSVWINDWMQWDGQASFVQVAEEFTDSSYGLTMRIPEEWSGKYTLRKPQNDPFSIVAIDYFNSGNGSKTEIATLYAVPQKDWEAVQGIWKDESKDYKELFADSGNEFAVSFAKEAPADLSEADKSSFAGMLKVKEQISSYLTIRND